MNSSGNRLQYLNGRDFRVCQQCFCVNTNFKRNDVVYFVQNSELLELFKICGFDHFGAIFTFDLAVCPRAGYQGCLQVMERRFWRGGDGFADLDALKVFS